LTLTKTLKIPECEIEVYFVADTMPDTLQKNLRSGGLDHGFSLVEIVLAIGLVSFSMLAIFALVAQGHKTGREARLESVAALLAGKVNSSLRASSAWTAPVPPYTTASLAAIASGSVTPGAVTNLYDINLDLYSATNPNWSPQFAVASTVSRFRTDWIVASDTNVTASLASIPTAGNAVFLTIEVSHPALAPEANRSKRSFASIITRTSTN
jgi:type II secretory pathway pseudopilin PulG